MHDLSVGEYLTDKYALWFNFRMINESALHGTGRRIEDDLEGVTLQIKKEAETTGEPKAYIYLIMDAQLDIKDGAFHSISYYENVGDAKNPYGTVCVSDWSWKNTFSLVFNQACVLQSF